jgi:transcriptional regulator with XRE-family HTH domain
MNPTLIGERIRHARSRLGLSQCELATLGNIHRLTVRAWESGANQPRLTTLYRLAPILGVAPSWLIAGEGPSPLDTRPTTQKDSVPAESSATSN